MRKPVVVLAGEDANDRRSLRLLLEEFCPQMRGRLVEINDPVRLRSASPRTLLARVQTLAKKVRARAALESTDVACVFVHEDLDDVDGPEWSRARQRVQEALTNTLGNAHYVLSVWEIEAWLLLFPQALAELVAAWSVPSRYRGRDTGMLQDPKRILTRECSPDKVRYRESDAPDVVAAAITLGCLDEPAGTNRSWNQFRTDAGECCRLHIPQRGRVR